VVATRENGGRDEFVSDQLVRTSPPPLLTMMFCVHFRAQLHLYRSTDSSTGRPACLLAADDLNQPIAGGVEMMDRSVDGK